MGQQPNVMTVEKENLPHGYIKAFNQEGDCIGVYSPKRRKDWLEFVAFRRTMRNRGVGDVFPLFKPDLQQPGTYTASDGFSDDTNDLTFDITLVQVTGKGSDATGFYLTKLELEKIRKNGYNVTVNFGDSPRLIANLRKWIEGD